MRFKHLLLIAFFVVIAGIAAGGAFLHEKLSGLEEPIALSGTGVRRA